MRNILLLFLLSCLVNMAMGQNRFYTTNGKAIKYYKEATGYFQAYNYDETLASIEKALKKDDKFIEAYLLMAEVYNEKKQPEKAIAIYEKAVRIDKDYYPKTLYFMALSQIQTGAYNKALENLEAYSGYKDKERRMPPNLEKLKAQCRFGMQAMANPVPFDPQNMGGNINSPLSEYSPALTAEEDVIIFTRLMPKEPNNSYSKLPPQEDFYVSKKTDKGWGPPIPFRPLNTDGNEGAPSISADGRVMAFTACHRSDGQGRCDIYFSYRIGNEWTRPQNPGPPLNSGAWEAQPSLSSDGRTLYFTSNRGGGKGKMDIWKSSLNNEGNWSKPTNLGDSINTKGDEMGPFIHHDNQTLYFASDSHENLGGLDLFMAHKQSDTTWFSPQNLGYPINTWNDEKNLVVSASGIKAFFATDRFEGLGGLDLYTFDLPEKIRPLKVTYAKGVVYDSKTRKKLKAKVEILNLATEKTMVTTFSDRVSGEFLACLPAGKNYGLHVSKQGYLFFSENFNMQTEASLKDPKLLDVPLKPIKAGQSVVLKNVFFDTDKFDLKPESATELVRLVSYLKLNANLKIELSGHTDNQGSKAHNKELSENRAKAVYEFLINKGIRKDRLSFKGYGMDVPLTTNDTEEGRAQNRRTEFKIVGE